MAEGKILFVTNDNFDAKISRVRFCEFLIKQGYKVHLLYPKQDNEINHNEIELHKFNKRGVKLSNLLKILKLSEYNRYNIYVFRGMESIILSIPLSFTSKPKITYLLTGLGRIFNGSGLHKRAIQLIFIGLLYILSLRRNTKVIVQNEDDQKVLRSIKTILIHGSGIKDPNSKKKSIPHSKVRVLTATRLIHAKGLSDILEFATLVSKEDLIEYYVVGDYSELNPFIKNRIKQLNKFKNINFTGFKSNITEYIEGCHFAFYPTRYREGSPRFLIESIAHGLIPITTKAPGCSQFLKYGIRFETTKTLIDQLRKYPKDKFVEQSYKNILLFKSTYSDDIIFKQYQINICS